MKTLQKNKRCYFFIGAIEDKIVRENVKGQDFRLETFFVKGSSMENITASAGTENQRSRIIF